MTRERRGGRGGFTLLETAVTIIIMGVVVAIGYTTFITLIDRRTQIRAAVEETERAAALRAMLEDWFARSYLQGPQGRVNPGTGDVTTQEKDMVSFSTRAMTPSLGLATMMLLYIDDNPSTPEHGLTVRYYGYGLDAPSWLTFSNTANLQTQDTQLRRVSQAPTARQLDDRVVGLKVEYLDRRTNRWLGTRDAASIQPVAARVTLEGSPDAPLPPLLQLPFIIAQQDDWKPRQ
jgi:prepilin-type N-terminal cleavage/methylation domain-containing protein